MKTKISKGQKTRGVILFFFFLTLLSQTSLANFFANKNEQLEFIKKNNLNYKQSSLAFDDKPQLSLINYQNRRRGRRRGVDRMRRRTSGLAGVMNRAKRFLRRMPRRFSLQVRGTRRCIGLRNRGTRRFTPAIYWSCDRTRNQTFNYDPRTRTLRPTHARNMCLDLDPKRNVLHLWSCHRRWNQQFVYDPATGLFLNPRSKKCITVRGPLGRNGAPIVLQKCSPRRLNQKWKLLGSGRANRFARGRMDRRNRFGKRGSRRFGRRGGRHFGRRGGRGFRRMSGRHIGRHRPHSDPYFRDGAEVAFLGGDGKQYCSDTREGITCNRDRVGKWERFTVVVVGHNKIALRSGRTGKYCAERENALECHSNRIREWEVFHVNRLSNMLSLRGGRTRKFCSDTEDGIICDKKFVKRSEVFTVVKLNEDGKPEHPRDQHHKVLEHPLHMYDKGIVREPRHPHTPAGEEEEFSASGMMREVEKGKGVYEFFFN